MLLHSFVFSVFTVPYFKIMLIVMKGKATLNWIVLQLSH